MKLRVLLASAVAGTLACSGGTTDPPGPESGVVVVSLDTPNNDRDGALVIRIVGDQTGLKAAGSYRLSAGTPGAGLTQRAVISGTIGDGDLIEFTVPDVSKIATYAVVVEQAAARGTYALLEPSGYNVVLRVK